jgi:uncharacterized hydrophobic protein (TIGR00271 family)
MNALATIVASYGLLQNSTAVVIGAMIIAMLLGPITGLALALVDGNDRLLRQSLLTEFVGVVIVLAVSLAVGYIHRDLPLTGEILSRTSPNILDLVIALAGGAAGAYATISSRLSVGLVGVAIATALVPPLATCSICLARGDYHLAFGGFLLFFANFVAIQFASSVVMWALGYHQLLREITNLRAYVFHIVASLFILIVLGGVLAINFTNTIDKQKEETQARTRLRDSLSKHPGIFLADVRFESGPTSTLVYAVIRTPYSLSPNSVRDLQAKMPLIEGKPVELHIRSVITKETTAKGYVNLMPPTAKTSESDDSAVEEGNQD